MLNKGLGFVFYAKDLASNKLQGLERRFSSLDDKVTGGTARMTSAFKQLAVGFGVFAAGAVTVAAAFKFAGAAGEFEQGLAAVGAVTKATAKEMNMLRDAAIEAGIKTQFSPYEAVSGLQTLATAGQTAKQATQTLIPVLDLAAGSLGQLGIAQAAEAVVGTLNAYGMAADQASNITDRLLRITELTNFQTRDFEGGLAKAAAAGAVFGQELNDVLITMGLLRNRNIDASSSSTAFREAVRRVGAEQRAQQMLTEAGVDVFDKSTGKMRSIVDIMTDFATATRNVSDEERNHQVVQAFGARGLLAFSSIMNASHTIMKDGQNITLNGAEAIAALREEMLQATGTADSFRQKTLDTFEGQKVLLRGTLQTYAVVLSEPFAEVFKPIVSAVVNALNFVLRAISAIPAPIKKAFAGMVLGVGVAMMLTGAIIMIKAAIPLLIVAIKLLLPVLGAIVAVALPVIAAMAFIAISIIGLRKAFERNIGGIKDIVENTWAKIRLVFDGLKQLFADGGFSGAVMEEMNRAGNQGIKQFVITVYQIAYRLKRIWEGIKEGFVSALEDAQPVFAELGMAMQTLRDVLGELFLTFTKGTAAVPSSEFASFGNTIGRVFGVIATWGAKFLTFMIKIGIFVAGVFKGIADVVVPVIKVLFWAISDIARSIGKLMGSTGDSGKQMGSTFDTLKTVAVWVGRLLGVTLTIAVHATNMLIMSMMATLRIIILIRDALAAAGRWIGEVFASIGASISGAFSLGIGYVRGFTNSAIGLFHSIKAWALDTFGPMAAAIAGFFAPVGRFFDGLGARVRSVFTSILDFVLKIIRQIPDSLLPASLEGLKHIPLSTEVSVQDQSATAGGRTYSAQQTDAPMPAVADVTRRSSESAALDANLSALNKNIERQKEREQQTPQIINVQVDGETIARATHKANRDLANRGFSPVPAY